LGASFDDVYACGPATGSPDDFDTVGFQCVELSDRFLWAVDGAFASNVPDGRDFVKVANSQLGIPIGTPGMDRLPSPGDVVSMWGGPRALGYGHTAVVTSVSVDGDGNGTIAIMEENGLKTGWDQIAVSNWSEAYGDPGFAGGAYYYNHVEWLELRPNTAPLPPTAAAIQYSVQGLGANSVPSAINDSGTVTGSIQHRQAGQPVPYQPFLYAGGKWSYPRSPSPNTRLVGINDTGAVAAWALDKSAPQAYALHPGKQPWWSKLPVKPSSDSAAATTSIDAWGDVSGWTSTTKTGAPSLGAIWIHSHGSYQLHSLAANHYFSRPVVTGADHWGDAIGTETIGGRTLGVLWAPWGKAYRLPPLMSKNGDAVATGMVASVGGSSRTLTVVGYSRDASSVFQACEWKVEVDPGSLHYSAPTELSDLAASGPSTAEALNTSGWVVGDLGSTGTSGRAFLWRPGVGMVDLQSLVSASSGWVILNVVGINSSGEIVGQGYNPNVPRLSTARGVVLQPHAVTAADRSGRHE